MSEDLRTPEKENTIDILVDPKKKEEKPSSERPAKSPSAPSQASKPAAPSVSPKPAAPKPAAPKAAAASKANPVAPKPSGSAPVPRKAVVPNLADRTRAIPVSAQKTRTDLRATAQETRVSRPVPETKAAPPKTGVAPKSEAGTEKAGPREAAEKKPRSAAGLRSTLIAVLIYVGVVVGISALLSSIGISWANDVFALVKDEVVATVTIPENAQIGEVADILKENGIIEYPFVFEFYINFKNRDADPPLAFKAGDYELRSTLNYDQIVSLIKDRKSRKIVTLTIPEGYTVDEIITLFTSQGIGTKEGFVDAIQNYDYTYRFMEELEKNGLPEGRKYRLEGYLFPDTYEFYTDSSEIAIIDKMLTAFDAHFEGAYYDRLEEMKMSLDEVVTLASIVQMEGKFTSDFYSVSGVFHNRLNSTNMRKLQSDATVQYCLPERKEELSYADIAIDSPYNTYETEGLPPSAITNPGWEAIQAALYPEENRYYYFVSDTDGTIEFAETEQMHLKNRAWLTEAIQNGTTIDVEKEKDGY